MKLKNVNTHEKWFSIPGDNGQVQISANAPATSQLHLEAMFTRAAAGGSITYDIEQIYLDAITDWQGVEDQEGNAAKCNLANKRLFLQQPGILSFVRDALEEVRQEARAERAEAQKN